MSSEGFDSTACTLHKPRGTILDPLKLGIKSKCQHTIKARSLEATLPAIIFVCDVFHVSLLEQDTTRKGRVFKNAMRCTRMLRERYENATQLEFEASNDEEYKVDGIWESAVYVKEFGIAKESEAGHQPEICLSDAASASTLPPLLGSGCCGKFAFIYSLV